MQSLNQLLKKISGAGDVATRGIRSLFVERQVYLRQQGKVHFFALTPRMQMTGVTLVAIALGWFTYSSFNMLLDNRAVELRNDRIRYLQSTYAQQIEELRQRYESAKQASSSGQEDLTRDLKALETRQNELADLLKNRQFSEDALDVLRRGLSDQKPDGAVNAEANKADSKRSEADFPGGMQVASNDPTMSLPSFQQPAQSVSNRMDRLTRRQSVMAAAIGDAAITEIRNIRRGIEKTKVVTTDMLLRQPASARNSQDGALFSLDAAPALDNPAASMGYARTNVAKLAHLETALTRVPLTSPLPNYEISSPFGNRTDPFTGRGSFHAGLDLVARYGAIIYAPAPGIISFAGWKSEYGRLIEIDHGNGFVTRYGHLSEIDVKAGQKVSLKTRIGHLGSTGRSTGAHLHYEVWYNGVVRNPANFLEAGRYVLAQK